MEPKEKDKKDRGGMTKPHKHEKDIHKKPHDPEEDWEEGGTASPQDEPSGSNPGNGKDTPPPPGP